MNISNAINTVSVSGSFSSSAKKTSEKNKWQLTDSLKEKIVELAKKDAKNNIYMGNEFTNLRKAEVAKVAPNRAKYKRQTKDGCVFYLGYHMRLNIKERELVLRSIYIMRKGKKFLHTLKG